MGAIVVGMHRSGTSAVTRVIDALGVPAGDSLLPALPENPEGFWEVAPLMDLNDDLLEHLGGSWDAPPAPDPGWAADVLLDEFLVRARRVFETEHPGDCWVWKDPRACVLLPFWMRVLGDGHCAVVMLRHPSAITRSLVRRNAIPRELGLAVWERSLRTAMRDVVGLPVLVLDYDDLVDEPGPTIQRLADFLRRRVPAATADMDRVAGATKLVSSELRHDPGERPAAFESSMSGPQLRLLRAAYQLGGEHDALPSVDLGEETPTTALLVSARRHGNLARMAESDAVAGSASGGVMAYQLALDAALVRTGELEQKADEAERILVNLADSLGYLELGRIEKSSLRVASILRRIRTRMARS